MENAYDHVAVCEQTSVETAEGQGGRLSDEYNPPRYLIAKTTQLRTKRDV